MEDEPRPRKRGQRKGGRKTPPDELIATLDAEIERVRRRDEGRLLRAARRAGLFDHSFRQEDLLEMCRGAIARQQPVRNSTLKRLVDRRARLAREVRGADARRKALLGRLVVAACRRRPDAHQAFAPDMREWLGTRGAGRAADANIERLAAFLDDPHSSILDDDGKGAGESGMAPGDLARERGRRLALLGEWLIERRAAVPKLAGLAAADLEGFLAQGARQRDRAALADLLKHAGRRP